MQWTKICLLALIGEASAQAFANPLLGPDFLPAKLPGNHSFPDAMKRLSDTLMEAARTGTSKFGALPTNETSFSIALFDSKSTLLESTYSSPALQTAVNGTHHIDTNTIFRIGSVSKLITAYLFLIAAGDQHWHDPITKHLPPLAAAAKRCSARENPTDCIDWDSITIGSLASHTSGIPREYSTFISELLLSDLDFPTLGLPLLNSTSSPTCALGFDDPCTENPLLNGIATRHPAFAPFTTPVYSNVGYTILGYALQHINNQSYASLLQHTLLTRLNLTRTTTAAPSNATNAVIPGSALSSGWAFSLGDETPAGGLFSTTSDLVTIAQSILNNRFLSPATTRKWMKPASHTSDLYASVGKPWEIIRTTLADGNDTGRVVDLYTKSGDLGAYSAQFVLLPAYDAGFVINAAGAESNRLVAVLADLVTDAFLPALETAAREETAAKIAGTYASSSAALNSTIELAVQDGKPGVAVTRLISNGTDLLPLYAELYGVTRVDLRLYPSKELSRELGDGEKEVSFRALAASPGFEGKGVFSRASGRATWMGVDSKYYGAVGVDEFLIRFDRMGRAVAVSPRVLRVVLDRVG